MLSRSPKGMFSPGSGFTILSTGTDSPVRAASSHRRFIDSSTRASAGILEPASTRITSPGTNWVASISRTWPARRTLTEGTANRFRAAMARSARYSWVKPRRAFKMTMMRIMMPSMVSPMAKEMMAATSKTRTMTSVNWPASTSSGLRRRRSSNWFGPKRCRPSAASSRVNPSTREWSRCSTTSRSSWYQSVIRSLFSQVLGPRGRHAPATDCTPGLARWQLARRFSPGFWVLVVVGGRHTTLGIGRSQMLLCACQHTLVANVRPLRGLVRVEDKPT